MSPKRKLFIVLLLSLLAVACWADVSHVKHHKHHRHHHHTSKEYEDEEPHYLPPHEEKEEEQPFYKKEKHTSERVVYHKEEEHEEPKEHHHHEEPKKQRVDHYHHYDKKPEVKTQHIHYKHSKPHVRTDYSRRDLFTPAASEVVYRRRRPSRILYASAPNSVFHTHTQINVQSQDSELNSLTPPGAQDPAGAQAPTGAQAPIGAQAPAAARPNCQFIVAGNAPPGCGPSDPIGAQLPSSALSPTGANDPANRPVAPTGQLATLGNGQRPSRPGYAGGYGGGNRLNFFVDPSLGAQLSNAAGAGGQQQAGAGQLAGGQGFNNQNFGGAQLGAGQGFNNQNQVDPSFGAQLPAAGQAPVSAGAPFDPSFGAQLPAAGQAPVSAGAPFDPSFGAQRPAAGQAQLAAGGPFDPSFGAQRPVAQRPLQNQFNNNGQFGAPFDPALGAQLGAAQPAPNRRPNPVGGQLAAGQQGPFQGAADPSQGLFDPSVGAQLAAGQVPRLNNRRPSNRPNYQGLNVLNGNVFGQPQLQGPTNAVGNQQDTNIIDGNFYSDPSVLLHHGHHHGRALVRLTGNQRSVLVPDDDDADDDVDPGFLAQFAASNRQSQYVAAPKKPGSHRSSSKRGNLESLDQGTSASEYDTDYREDGYHYQKPKHTFEF
ncbi:collagen alpha-2(I) chain [Drosophila bipectinata]|uniref:collagen alpha-2(I) chain n=1 Tax=Drosophila bipectinata TaxID=42026 RepID=UPI001C891FBD|nr:fibril-forming collagen alpha chain [Drosophila bipectinata]